MITSFGDLQKLILDAKGDLTSIDWHQYGEVTVNLSDDGLALFSYMRTCQFKRPEEWNWFEKVSRGLVMSIETGEIVARPFDKFWNYGEVFPTGEIKEITEKMDGSLGICFWWDGKWRVCTRGSFTSDQAVWAQQFLDEHYDLFGFRRFGAMNRDLTLLLEIIYPENRVVVDYGSWNQLVFIGMRNRITGKDYWMKDVAVYANSFGFVIPEVRAMEDIDSLIKKAKRLGPEYEGWVVRYTDGTRVKIKGAAYLEIHKWINTLSPKSVAKSLLDGTFYELLSQCPDQLQDELDEIRFGIDGVVSTIYVATQCFMEDAPKSSRKEFALWVKEQDKCFHHYLFRAFDGRLTPDYILEKEYL